MATTSYLRKLAAEKKQKRVLSPYTQTIKAYDVELVKVKVGEDEDGHPILEERFRRKDRKIHHKKRIIK